MRRVHSPPFRRRAMCNLRAFRRDARSPSPAQTVRCGCPACQQRLCSNVRGYGARRKRRHNPVRMQPKRARIPKIPAAPAEETQRLPSAIARRGVSSNVEREARAVVHRNSVRPRAKECRPRGDSGMWRSKGKRATGGVCHDLAVRTGREAAWIKKARLMPDEQNCADD
jgi:hypothetical protein